MDDASKKANSDLAVAVAAIDSQFGHDYAKKNPALVGSLVQALAIERLAAALDKIASRT